jgi:inorganic pyrophosphatase
MSLKNVPFGTIDRFNVVVEIPKGSENKYEYNEELDAITLEWVFTGGFCFPFDYGFIPQTRGGDDDSLDAFVISRQHFYPGIVVPCKAIGAIEVLDRGKRDDKIITVPLEDPDYKNYESLDELSFDYKKIFLDFFKELAIQKGKKIEVVGFRDKAFAVKEIEEGVSNFK